MGMTTNAPEPEPAPPRAPAATATVWDPARHGPARPDAAPSGAPGAEAGPATAPVRVTRRCQGCGACLPTCPAHAIRPRHAWAARGHDPLHVVPALCTGCGECLEVCPVDAIEEVE